MGQNLAGFPQIKVSGKAGQQVRLYLSETLTAQGTCNQKQSGSPYYLNYTLSGKGEKASDGKRIETWHPHFTYYGYRYIQVEGAVMKGDENPDGKPVIEDIQSCFVYNSAAKIGSFECSNPMFNRAYQIIDRASEAIGRQYGLTVRIVKNSVGWSRIGSMARDWYTTTTVAR
jgi:hypothetical protein